MGEWSLVGLTAALVLVTAYYAWQNRQMVRELHLQRAEMIRQGKLQGYERRAAIFRGVLRCLGYIVRDGRVGPEVIPGFLEATSEKEFLLEEDLCRYLTEIYMACLKTWVNQNQWDTLPVGDEKTRLMNEHRDLVIWLIAQSVELRERFSPYLRVGL